MPGTADAVATSSAELVGQGHSLEREGDLGSPSGGPAQGMDRPAGLQASGCTLSPTAAWV